MEVELSRLSLPDAYLLVALGLGVFALAVWALFWAIDDGQYDDLEKHGSDILGDEPPAG